MKSAEEIAHMRKLYHDGWSKRRIAAHLGISRNTLDRYLRLEGKSCVQKKQKLIRSINNQQDIKKTASTWHIGPYEYTSAGELSLGGWQIELSPAQKHILLLFAKKPNQLISYEEVAQELWPRQEPSPQWRRNVRLAVHRLRQVFAIGPLGGTIIRSVYQKGYVLRANVEVTTPLALQKHVHSKGMRASLFENPYYGEVHDYWANRDPYKLPRQESLLQKCVVHDPLFHQGYLELCYFQLLQCFWGMRASEEVLPTLRTLVETVDSFAPAPPGWLGIKAEAQSLLLWQPHSTEALYGS